MQPKPRPHRLLHTHRFSRRRAVWRAKRFALQHGSSPILCGPWRGEVGFESLYWIPFLDKLKEHGISPERLIPIGRAGSASWYGCPQGMELYALRDPQNVRLANRVQVEKSGYLKQESVTDWDRAVLADAAKKLNLRSFQTLHPAWMYHRLAPFYTGWMGLEGFASQVTYRPLTPPAIPDQVPLPPQYVAVKFYARETFPWPDKTIRPFIQAVIQRLLDTGTDTHVLLLDAPEVADDHADFPVEMTHPRLGRLSQLVKTRPETTLAIQSAIIARAMGFVGTYGGMAQLALRLGRPSVSFYTQWGGTSVIHKHLSDQLSLRSGVPCHVYAVSEIALARAVLPDVAIQPGDALPPLDTRKKVLDVAPPPPQLVAG